MIKTGSIALSRELLNWTHHTDPKMVSLWVHLLLMAAYADHDWKGTTICRGQFPTTVRRLAEITGLTPDEVRARLDILEETKEITKETLNKTPKKGTIITICKYGDYQRTDTKKTPNKNPKKPQIKPQQHNNRNTDIDSFTNVQESTLSVSASAEFLKFLEWINSHAAEVSKMQQPFTEDQYCEIQQNYDPREVADVLEAMSNTANLTRKYKSAYKTCKSWLNLRKDRRETSKTTGSARQSKINTDKRLNVNDQWQR